MYEKKLKTVNIEKRSFERRNGETLSVCHGVFCHSFAQKFLWESLKLFLEVYCLSISLLLFRETNKKTFLLFLLFTIKSTRILKFTTEDIHTFLIGLKLVSCVYLCVFFVFIPKINQIGMKCKIKRDPYI